MYCGYVTTLKNVRPHPNADRMKLADCFGNTVCVGLDAAEGEIGIYFPSDGQLSMEFAKENNLLRLYDENGHSIPGGGYLEPDKRNIKAISLRGVKSDGLFCSLSCVAYTGVNLDDLQVGQVITVINGHEICQKYIPRGNKSSGNHGGANRTRKKKAPLAPLFAEHADTEQLAYNLAAFKAGDEIEITLKMHGTSQRTGYLPVLKGYKRSLLDKILRRPGEPVYDWDYVSGTRRTVLDSFEGGFYGSNEFRENHHTLFKNKLWKGETVYYEVVGYTHTGAPIMATGSTPKEYVKEYGKKMEFSYGCKPPKSDIYVYRMTMTNEDGNVVEYTPDFMRYRCEQMGVKTVPVFEKFTIGDLRTCPNDDCDVYTTTPEDVIKIAEEYYDGPDPIGKTHIREGVVCRIINHPKFTAYKHKNWCFKVVEGIVKENADAPDMEEAESVVEGE